MTEKKMPWEMETEEFIKYAKKGKLHENTVSPSTYKIGSQQTALSLGESEGYPYEDIAYFYISRRMLKKYKKTWQEEILEPGWTDDNKDLLELAHYEFLSDAIYKGKKIPKYLMKKYLDDVLDLND